MTTQAKSCRSIRIRGAICTYVDLQILLLPTSFIQMRPAKKRRASFRWWREIVASIFCLSDGNPNRSIETSAAWHSESESLSSHHYFHSPCSFVKIMASTCAMFIWIWSFDLMMMNWWWCPPPLLHYLSSFSRFRQERHEHRNMLPTAHCFNPFCSCSRSNLAFDPFAVNKKFRGSVSFKRTRINNTSRWPMSRFFSRPNPRY